MKRFGPSPPCLLLLLFLCPRVPPIFLAPPVGLGVPSISPPPSIPSPTPADPTISHATETGGIHRRPKEYIPFPFFFLFLCRSTRILFYVSLTEPSAAIQFALFVCDHFKLRQHNLFFLAFSCLHAPGDLIIGPTSGRRLL